jgi:hypothetical protein
MCKYRIKIEERNNGDKVYIPQVAKLSIVGRLWPKTNINWENIIYDKPSDYYHTAYSITQMYSNYDLALSVIEGYKVSIKKKNGESVKTVTYKMID